MEPVRTCQIATHFKQVFIAFTDLRFFSCYFVVYYGICYEDSFLLSQVVAIGSVPSGQCSWDFPLSVSYYSSCLFLFSVVCFSVINTFELLLLLFLFIPSCSYEPCSPGDPQVPLFWALAGSGFLILLCLSGNPNDSVWRTTESTEAASGTSPCLIKLSAEFLVGCLWLTACIQRTITLLKIVSRFRCAISKQPWGRRAPAFPPTNLGFYILNPALFVARQAVLVALFANVS